MIQSSSGMPTTIGHQGTASENHEINLRATGWLRPHTVGQTERLGSYISLVGDAAALGKQSGSSSTVKHTHYKTSNSTAAQEA